MDEIFNYFGKNIYIYIYLLNNEYNISLHDIVIWNCIAIYSLIFSLSCADHDRNGVLDFDEFLIGIKGEMNENRKKFVRMAFNILDKDRSGFITIDEMMDVYNFSHHPEVKSGKKTIKEAAKQFMGQWDDVDGDGSISYKEFEEHYKGVSASIDGDDYFELMMRNAWRISGGEGAAANTANKRVLVTNKDGSQSVQTINNELGMRAGDKEEARRRLAQQGIDAADIGMFGGVDNKSKTARKPGANPLLSRTQPEPVWSCAK